MSWSVSMIGKPERVVEELSKYSETISGQSKAEYEEARPHLQSLVLLCVGQDLLVKLDASGHANFDSTSTKTYGNVQVSLSQFYSKLAL